MNQDSFNKAVLSACEAFRCVVGHDVYGDYVIATLFLKYISDVYRDKKNPYVKSKRYKQFNLPDQSDFYFLYGKRLEPGNGNRFDKAFAAIEKANEELKGVFCEITFDNTKLGEEKQKNRVLGNLLEAFYTNDLDLSPSRLPNLDVIGNTYEYLLKTFASLGGKQKGEFYTPPEVSSLVAKLVKPLPGDEICDPTCGSGFMLIQCGKRIRRDHKSRNYTLFGQDVIRKTWSMAKMNMFMHREYYHTIEWGDTINEPKLLDDKGRLRCFDVIVGNPPYSLNNWGHEDASRDRFHRFRRGVPPKSKGDFAFILHMIKTMKPVTGRVGVVVPHGILFRGGSEGKIRQKLIEENLLDTVIGLPEKLFYGTSIPAVILIFKKQKVDRNVLFIDASKGYKKGKVQNFLERTHINKILKACSVRKFEDKYANVASLEEITENDFNLNIPRYVDTYEEEEQIDLLATIKDRKEINIEIARLESVVEGHMKELGLI